MENDALVFAEETVDISKPLAEPWKILIVDDDKDIHTVTKLALDGVVINDRPLAFTSAYSAGEAKDILSHQKDIALIFLDIVMEHNLAGLDVVEYIRESLNNNMIRIIIRTGEPGSAPERMIIDNYDINDYKEKTELNVTRLYTSVRSSLLQYEQLSLLYAYQNDLETVIEDKVREISVQEEALIESNRQAQMGDFLNMISHQWRQPLSRIGAVISQMKVGLSLENLTPEDMDEMIDNAEKYVQNLAKIIKDFQNLYRVEENKSYVTVSEIIESTLSLLRASLEQEGIKVLVDDSKIKQTLKLSSEMNQVFINIIKNAYDAIVQKKQKSGIIQIRFNIQKKSIIIEIEDNAGFNKMSELTDKIFDPYVSGGEERQGRGMGLYICKMIVEKHCHGKISVSKGDHGARFTILLPMEMSRSQ